jgi:hypothetical protein
MGVAQLSWSETAGWVSAPGHRTDSALVFFFSTHRAIMIAEAAGYASA